MLAYNYDPVTFAFTGASEADPDPMTPGEFLFPANSTLVEPVGAPAPGQVLVWQGEAWGLVSAGSLIPLNTRIVNAPGKLFLGPTMKEVFNG